MSATQRQTSVPTEILTDVVVEEIKTRVCFVGRAFELSAEDSRPSQPQQLATPYHVSPDDDMIDVDHPHSDAAQSESELSRTSMDVDGPVPGSRVASSSYSIVSRADSRGTSSSHPGEHEGSQVLADLYRRHSTASDIQIPVTPPISSGGLGRGVLMIPGWIRERAAEVLFEGGDVDEVSIAEVILDSLLKASFPFHYTPIVPRLTSPMLPRFRSTFGRQWLQRSWSSAVPRWCRDSFLDCTRKLLELFHLPPLYNPDPQNKQRANSDHHLTIDMPP